MFGSVGVRTVEYLENALEDIRGERGHKLEPVHNNSDLKQAELNIALAIDYLHNYAKKGGS